MATVIGLFDRVEDAERAVEMLLNRGFVKDELGIITGATVVALTGLSISEEDAHVYAERVKRGGALVTLQAGDERVAAARELLRANADAHRAEERQRGWSDAGETAVSRPETDPEQLATRIALEKSRSDPLLDLEVDKGGT